MTAPRMEKPVNDTVDLATITLDRGPHDSRDNGMCLMEAVAYVAGEQHSDKPACVSPVLIEMGQRLSDLLADDRRQELVSLIPALLGTRGDGLDGRRGYLALDWLIRTSLPTWLDLAGLTAEATALRGLRQITGPITARTAGRAVRIASSEVRAAWLAANAAWNAARSAAWLAANAAWNAAGVAANVAWVAPGDAAWDAVGVAANAAWVAERRGGADEDALRSTVDHLQTSAIELYATMIRGH